MVYRTEVFELIQYRPQTTEVFTEPLLMVPPVINKFYILDISPGRSMIEYLVAAGLSGVRDLVAESRCSAARLGL